MKRILTLLWCAMAVTGCSRPSPDTGAGAATGSVGTAPSAASAAAHLQSSTRHGEWVMVPAGAGDSVRAWVVYPERSDRAPVVLVIHEIFGVSQWIRAVTDQLAAEGFIAIAPDLLTGKGVPNDSLGDPVANLATQAIRTLAPADVDRRIRAVAAYGTALPAATDRYGLVGFCWGGGTVFTQATTDPDLDAVVVFYGTSPESGTLRTVRAPILGHYGGSDARVNASVPAADSAMRALGRTFEVRMWDGAGHGFLRQQNAPGDPNHTAAVRAWPETVNWFRRHLEQRAG